jgi:hypothetical protein
MAIVARPIQRLRQLGQEGPDALGVGCRQPDLIVTEGESDIAYANGKRDFETMPGDRAVARRAISWPHYCETTVGRSPSAFDVTFQPFLACRSRFVEDVLGTSWSGSPRWKQPHNSHQSDGNQVVTR